MSAYLISRDISGQRPLRVVVDDPPPCLWCGDPVTEPSMDGPLVCALCDMGRRDDADDWMMRKQRRDHFAYVIDHIAATQPEGKYPPFSGPEYFTMFRLNGVPQENPE